MVNLCLINPPLEDFYSTSIRRQPLGLLYIAAYLKKYGYEIEFINCHSPKKQKIAWPKQFVYLKEFINPPNINIRFPFKNYYHFGLSYQEIERQIKNARAEIFFISAMFTTYYEEVEKIILLIRKNKPQARIILGGYHASLYRDYYLDKLQVEVISGEGEYAAVKILTGEQYNSKYLIEDLDSLPLPAREILKPRDFKVYKQRATSLIMSRGCPNQCKFCSSRDFWGNTYRLRSAGSVIREIEECYEKYGITLFNFEDDNLFLNRVKAQEFLSEFIKYQKDNNLSFDLTAMNGVSIETVDEMIIKLMSEAGFREINLSLVSYSADLQNKLGRPFNSDKFTRIVLTAQKYKMNVRTYFILGLPAQSKTEIDLTINFLQDLKVKVFPSVFYNVYAPKEQWKMQRSSAFFNETEYLSREDLLYYFNKTLALN